MLLKKSLTAVAFAIAALPCQIHAQNDTIYVNEIGTLLPKSQALYYRIIEVDDTVGVVVKEYFLNGKLHCSGHFTSRQAIIKQGRFVYFNADGFKASEGQYTKGFKSGEWKLYDDKCKKIKERQQNHYPCKGYYSIRYDAESGDKLNEGDFDENDRKAGVWKEYHFHSDAIRQLSRYLAGRRTGEQLEFYKNSRLKRKEIIEGYKVKHAEQYDEEGRKVKYFPAFVYPVPPEPLWKYLSVRVKCFDSLIKSTNVHYSLKVNKDGAISDIELTGLSESDCKTAIIEAIARMKKWKPAKWENVPCNHTVEYDLKFRIFNE